MSRTGTIIDSVFINAKIEIMLGTDFLCRGEFSSFIEMRTFPNVSKTTKAAVRE